MPRRDSSTHEITQTEPLFCWEICWWEGGSGWWETLLVTFPCCSLLDVCRSGAAWDLSGIRLQGQHREKRAKHNHITGQFISCRADSQAWGLQVDARDKCQETECFNLTCTTWAASQLGLCTEPLGCFWLLSIQASCIAQVLQRVTRGRHMGSTLIGVKECLRLILLISSALATTFSHS